MELRDFIKMLQKIEKETGGHRQVVRMTPEHVIVKMHEKDVRLYKTNIMDKREGVEMHDTVLIIG